MTDIQHLKITDLIPDNQNANTGTERGLRALDDSLAQYGAGRSVLLDNARRVIAGNKTVERAIDQGFEDILIVRTDGSQLVAVQRTDLDLTDDENPARALAYADNRVGELDLAWDAERLLADLNAGLELPSSIFQDYELAELLGELLPPEEPADDPGAQMDKAAELQEQWQVKRGDVWQIGAHRLMCGDSMNADDVAVLMDGERAQNIHADPPYGIDYERGKYDGTVRKSNMPSTIVGDDLKGQNQQEFICKVFTLAQKHTEPNGTIYMWSAPLAEGVHSMFGLIDAGLHIQSQLVWNKSHFVLGRSDYQWKHEVCWYGYWNGKDRVWNGGRTQTTVIDAQKLAATLHPNEKPSDLITYLLSNSTNPNDIVYDPFGGSGTTMVACEQLNRKCRMMEISEKYCAVILERMAGMGLDSERVANGET
jgi:DNA modification methylase